MESTHQDLFKFIVILFFIVLFFFTIATYKKTPKPEKKKPEPIVVKVTMSLAFNIAITFTIGITIAIAIGANSIKGLTGQVKELLHPVPTEQTNFYYHSDSQYDDYIKGNLNHQELSRFDRILDYEYTQGGLRLYGSDLEALADGDEALVKAYGRWRRCKELRRSSSGVIYPCQR